MEDSDYEKLKQLEDAFKRKDLPFFKAFLDNSKECPLLLRIQCVCMLEHIGNEDMVSRLCQVLKSDENPLTRHEAAFTLGQLGLRSGVPSPVEAMLRDRSPIVRHEAAVALSSIGDDAVAPELQKAIEDEDEDVRNSALIAFEYLSYLGRKKNVRTEYVAKPKIRL
jgi:deoxyhypusine monooxygenase